MKNAIILHGKPDKAEYYDPAEPACSNAHWYPWLQKQLIVQDIAAQTPEVPDAWKPDYHTWQHEFERYEITPETILVGHSCGGGFLVRWLSEHPNVKVGRVVLVAPWLDPNRENTIDFFEFSIDPLLAQRTAKLSIFHSDNDYDSVQKSLPILQKALHDVSYREFHNYGHFCIEDMKTEKFPELLEELISN